MYELTSKILITGDDGRKWDFKGAVDVEVVSTWDTLTDICKITIPKKYAWLKTKNKEAEQIALTETPLLRKGNEISISYGLDKNISEWFKGYISNIYAGATVGLNCQDAMFLLKQGQKTFSYEKVTLSKLLKDAIGGVIPFKVVADYDLGGLRSSQGVTAAQLLNKLNEDYFIKFFIRDGVLYAGLGIVPELQKTHKIKYVIENNLEYIRKDDQKIKLKAVIMYPNNTSKKFETGDMDGEERTVHFYDISEKEAKKLCEQKIDEYRYEGFKGTLSTFIIPNINHGDIIQLPKGLNGLDEASEGKYLVKKVIKYVKDFKARQDIELERRIK